MRRLMPILILALFSLAFTENDTKEGWRLLDNKLLTATVSGRGVQLSSFTSLPITFTNKSKLFITYAEVKVTALDANGQVLAVGEANAVNIKPGDSKDSTALLGQTLVKEVKNSRLKLTSIRVMSTEDGDIVSLDKEL